VHSVAGNHPDLSSLAAFYGVPFESQVDFIIHSSTLFTHQLYSFINSARRGEA
jgi:hypothetical protein